MQYTVQQNETIMDVAKKTGADPKELMFINYIDESIPIEMGDILEVPGEGGGEMKNFQLGGSVQNQMPPRRRASQRCPPGQCKPRRAQRRGSEKPTGKAARGAPFDRSPADPPEDPRCRVVPTCPDRCRAASPLCRGVLKTAAQEASGWTSS
jgi:hypothetical protein